MDFIKVENISKMFTANGIDVQAIHDLSFSIAKGEFSALAGPSGSGKTTLLNLIGGLDQPTKGIITINGQNLEKMSSKQASKMRLHHIGFIFQAYNLIPVLTAVENVEYVLLLQGMKKKERRDKAQNILHELGLSKEYNRLPREMSGGQQQRVAVARAIVAEPDIVLADEPTANLDQQTGRELLDLMKQLNSTKQITFLFSTHDPMVMEQAKRLIYLKDGQISSDDKRQ